MYEITVTVYKIVIKLFKGNFKELHSLVEAAKGATFKVLCGVRENAEGKVFQTVYNRLVLRSWETNYSKFEAEISNISNAFLICSLR